MNQTHQHRLSACDHSHAAGGVRQAFYALLLPFEVLHRHRWSAPWNADER